MFYSGAAIKMPFGKHRGQTIEQIYQIDASYLSWMVREGIVKNGINYGQMAKDCLKRHETDEESPNQDTYTIYACAECEKRSPYNVFIECPFCADALCGLCLKLHEEMHRKARAQRESPHADSPYANRREYGYRSGPMSQKEIDEMIERMFGRQSSRANGNGTYTHTFTRGVSKDITAAFERLDLPTTATVQQIKQSFRTRAKTAHPDTGGSEEQFKKLNAAYQLALQHAERK